MTEGNRGIKMILEFFKLNQIDLSPGNGRQIVLFCKARYTDRLIMDPYEYLREAPYPS